MENNGTLSVEMWAIIIGATDSLIEISMPFGYELKHIKLTDSPIRDSIINGNGKLDAKYIAGNLSKNEEPEFVFIYKSNEQEFSSEYFAISEMISGTEKAYLRFDEIRNNWNYELFLVLSMLRLCQEGNIEIADKFFAFNASLGCNRIDYNVKSSVDMPISVYEDLYEWDNSSLSVYQDMRDLPVEVLSLLRNVFERFGRGYISSRYEDAYKNLITLCEIILIGYNSADKKGRKKEKFANRITAAIASDDEAQSVQSFAETCYKYRSDETHEGKTQNIDKEALKKLRCIVRKLIIDLVHYLKVNYMMFVGKDFDEIKKAYIKKLLVRVEYLQNNGYIKEDRNEQI